MNYSIKIAFVILAFAFVVMGYIMVDNTVDVYSAIKETIFGSVYMPVFAGRNM